MTVIYEYEDKWGPHVHYIHGSPYEPKTRPGEECDACGTMLLCAMVEWRNVLTERHNLPSNFWRGSPLWTTS